MRAGWEHDWRLKELDKPQSLEKVARGRVIASHRGADPAHPCRNGLFEELVDEPLTNPLSSERLPKIQMQMSRICVNILPSMSTKTLRLIGCCKQPPHTWVEDRPAA